MVEKQSRVECLVRGRVQGVWFRKQTQTVARALSLSGWVRNLEDGRVQIVAEGPEGDVARLLQWAWTGAELARVDHVDVETGEPTGVEPSEFEVRATATSPEAVPS